MENIILVFPQNYQASALHQLEMFNKRGGVTRF